MALQISTDTVLDSTSSNDLELKENKLVLIENCAKIYLGQTQES